MDKKLLAVIKREYSERVRSKWFLVGTLIVPALVVATFLLPIYLAVRSESSDKALDIMILDASGAGLGERVRTNLVADPSRLGASTSDAADAAPAESAADQPDVQIVTSATLAQAESLATAAVMSKERVVFSSSTLRRTFCPWSTIAR